MAAAIRRGGFVPVDAVEIHYIFLEAWTVRKPQAAESQAFLWAARKMLVFTPSIAAREK